MVESVAERDEEDEFAGDIKRSTREFIDPTNIRLKGDLDVVDASVIPRLEFLIDSEWRKFLSPEEAEKLKQMNKHYEERLVSVDGVGREQAVQILSEKGISPEDEGPEENKMDILTETRKEE